MIKYSYRPSLDDIPAYDGVERPFRIKVNANESNMSMPPLVEDRLMGRLSRLAFNRYPGEEYELLAESIAAAYGLNRENVLLGNGSSEIIEKIFYAFGGRESSRIVFPQPSFSMYRIYAKAAEAKGVPVDLADDYTFDKESFLRTVKERKTSLTVVCNPNNPTGTAIPLADIEYIAQNIDCPFLLDEAYMEFYGETATPLLAKYPHLIVARTFSKAYGLAGARVGYMLAAPEIINVIKRAFMPYHLNVISAVTADTVWQMRDEYAPRLEGTITEREHLAASLKELPGVTVYPSRTNFLLFHYEKADALNDFLEAQSIGVRNFGKAPRLENCLRVSMGLPEENDIWFGAIKKFVTENA